MIGCLPSAQTKCNTSEQHPTGDPSAEIENNKVAEKRMLEANMELSLRKTGLVDITNMQTNPVPETVASMSKSGPEQNICSELTSREKKLMKELRKTKCTLRALNKSAKLIENLDSEVLKGFVASAFQNQKRKPQGRLWTPKNKISALAIYKRLPKTYRYMAHHYAVAKCKNLTKPFEKGANGHWNKQISTRTLEKKIRQKKEK